MKANLLIDNLIAKIKCCITETPSLPLPLCRTVHEYCFKDHKFKEKQKIPLIFNCKTIFLVLRILEICVICQNNILEEKYITKRNLYYQLAKYYDDYAQIDEDIAIICQSIGVKRKQIHILASSKCTVYGKIVVECESKLYGNLQEMAEILLPTSHNLQIRKIAHSKVILVEKESVYHSFKQYLSSQYLILTAKGYPDVATRQFLMNLQNHIDKIYYLGDYDVYGFDIFCFYAFGDAECEGLLSSIELLELDINDSELFNKAILDEDVMPLDKSELKKSKTILEREYFRDNLNPSQTEINQKIMNFKEYFKGFIKGGKKAEIESFIKASKQQNWIFRMINKN